MEDSMDKPDQHFDLEDPVLPKWVDKGALASGGFPYEKRLKDSAYLEQVETLQLELVKLQTHLQKSSGRVVMLFEGRDAAGKGGAIKTYSENLNPRLAYDVALPKPSDREASQWYFQRYIDWLPAGGETALFDRSWYNRAGVEPVMGFCKPEQTDRFLDEAPRFEAMLIRDGVHLFKFWLSIGREMQLKRFHSRRHDPLKAWKISPIDLAAIEKWDEYTKAAHRMFAACHKPDAPWHVVLGNDKLRARLELMRTVLTGIDYEGKDKDAIGDIDDKIVVEPERFMRQHSQS
jgi:polyphosphate kinase 2